MRVSSLAVDPFTNLPIVILKDEEGRQAVPIWVGLIEASAIAAELEHVQLDRPMTHDLLTCILGRCGVRVDRVEVHDVRANTFYALIHLERADGSRLSIDARPSDAIAIALRTGAVIHVARRVIEKARRIDLRCPALGAPEPPARRPAGTVRTHREPEVARPPAGPPPPTDEGDDYLAALGENAFGKWKM